MTNPLAISILELIDTKDLLTFVRANFDVETVFRTDEVKKYVVENFDPHEIFSHASLVKWAAHNYRED